MARPICLRLLLHWMRAAASRTFWTAGNSRPIRMAMMAMTTRSSISVKPRRLERGRMARTSVRVRVRFGEVRCERKRSWRATTDAAGAEQPRHVDEILSRQHVETESHLERYCNGASRIVKRGKVAGAHSLLYRCLRPRDHRR